MKLISIDDAKKRIQNYKFEKCDGKYAISYENYYNIYIN